MKLLPRLENLYLFCPVGLAKFDNLNGTRKLGKAQELLEGYISSQGLRKLAIHGLGYQLEDMAALLDANSVTSTHLGSILKRSRCANGKRLGY